MTAVADFRVLDLTRGPAAGLATMILADFGAEVLAIEGPRADPMGDLPSARLWRRGKKTLALDLDQTDAMTTFHELCAGADVLVCNWRTSALKRKGLGWESLRARHPHLVFCHITGFGGDGPKANYPGYEHVVAAAVGRMNVFAGIVDRSGPVYSALQVGVHATAQSAVSGVLAALLAREADGAGRLVETSMLQGMLPYEQGSLIARQFPERAGLPPARSSGEPPMPSLYYHPAQAGDGRWMQFGNLLPHLFDNFLMVTDLADVLADPDWNAAQMLLPKDKHEVFRERMLKRIQARPASDWMADMIANGSVVATVYQATREALVDPDVRENGHVIDMEEGGLQLGPVARLTGTPAEPGAPCAADESYASTWGREPRAAPFARATATPPLEGKRVVEIATIIAAPLGASFLADMGAEVIKLEQIGGDPYRGLNNGIGSARVNAGKRSISVDLKATSGRELALDLLRTADVLIHNFRPGVPERLGIGYDDISAINPGIVYVQSNGYGPDGPGAERPSTHPIPGAAMGGVVYQMGERLPRELQDIEGLRLWTRRLMRANEVNPDPNTALVVATASLLGLVARTKTGRGQRILVDMFGANAYANYDDFLDYPGKPDRVLPDELGFGLSPTYRLYACADDEWVFLALTTDRERERFVSLLAEAGCDCPDVRTLKEGDSSLVEKLSRMFASRGAAFFEDLLAPHGIGCVRADGITPAEFFLDDPQAKALHLAVPAVHPAWGAYRRHGANVTFDGKRPDLTPPPLAGQHAREILAELGYSAERVEALLVEGVLFVETGGD